MAAVLSASSFSVRLMAPCWNQATTPVAMTTKPITPLRRAMVLLVGLNRMRVSCFLLGLGLAQLCGQLKIDVCVTRIAFGCLREPEVYVLVEIRLQRKAIHRLSHPGLIGSYA